MGCPSRAMALCPGLHLGTVAADAIDLDPHGQSLLPGPAERILVGAQEALGELVDVLVGPGFGHARLAVEDHVGLRIVPVLHRDDDAGVAAQVLRLEPPFGGVEEHLVAFDVHPDHRHLRRSVGVARDDVAVGLVLEDLLHGLRQCHHHDSASSVPEDDYPRPMNGILVAMTVRNCTLASSGRLAMYTTARATCWTSIVGSAAMEPFGCGTPVFILAVSSVSALPMSIWPQAMSYFRPSREVDLVRPVMACLVAV